MLERTLETFQPYILELKTLKFQRDFLTPELILEHPAHKSPPCGCRPWLLLAQLTLFSAGHHWDQHIPLILPNCVGISLFPVLQAEVICHGEVYNFQRVCGCPTFWKGGTLHKSFELQTELYLQVQVTCTVFCGQTPTVSIDS